MRKAAEKKYRIITRLDQFAFPIELSQYANREDFCVIYGKQVKAGLSYVEAARELGECILHALSCEGMILEL